ncbi:unnamed protein product [Closterium sp. NIES-54]
MPCQNMQDASAMTTSRRVAILLVAFILSLASPSSAVVTINPSQAAVLAECQGQWQAQLRGWSKGGDCAQVEGVRCNAAGFIVSLNVSGKQLEGPIPDAIGNLTALTQLHAMPCHVQPLPIPFLPHTPLPHNLEANHSHAVHASRVLGPASQN